MEEQEKAPRRRLEKKSGKTLIFIFCIIAILLLTAIFYFYPKKQTPSDPVATEPIVISQLEPVTTGNSVINDEGKTGVEPKTVPEKTTKVPDSSENKNTSAELQPQIMPTDSAQTKQPIIKNQCNPYLENIEIFFETLDSRAYIHNFNLDQSSTLYFPKLIQRLVDNPPIVTGETDDLYTVLQNTAHFFRIIGKKNIFILKGILDREKETFERTLSDFYYLTKQPHCLKERFNLDISNEALYLYSGFFLNTMGGRLYLFRRDSMSRMVVNFYSILIMDEANREGRNKYGISINDSIDNLIDEIESSRLDLQMRNYYLDTLYDMKEKYQ